MELIEGLWVALADVYGGRFTRDFGVDPSKGAGTTWARGLAGLNQEQIIAGIEACVAGADGWPPSLPTFRARCLGIPSLAQVKLELRLNGERSGFTVLVWQYIDTHRLETSSAEQGDHLLRETYEFVRQGVMAGQLTVPPPALRLEAEKTDPLPPKEKLAKPETVAEAASAIDAMFGRHRPAAPDTDSRPATGKMAAAGSDA